MGTAPARPLFHRAQALTFVGMRSTLIRFFHLCMAVVMLFSSMGFGLVEHSCQMRGKQLYSVHADKAGCGACQVRTHEATQAATIERTACCKTDARYTHVEATSSLNQLTVKLPVSTVATFGGNLSTLLTVLAGWLVEFQAGAPSADYASPPPLSGRQLLVFVQIMLI